jgi:hypothetical protein
MKLICNSDVNVEEWNELIAANEFSSPFQTPEFYQLFNSVSGQSAEVFAVQDMNALLALCVVTVQKEAGTKGYFSRRGIIYGGPLVAKHESEALSLLLIGIKKAIGRKVIYTETRNLNDYSEYKEIFEKEGWQYEPYLNYHLSCSTKEEVWSRLNSNRQRQIKKALKTGIICEEAKTAREVGEYYKVLSDLYIKKIKKPVFSLEFFQKLFLTNLAKFILVKYNDKIIGGIVAPVFRNKVIYEFYICGLDSEFKDQSPSVMATYAAIEYGFKNGYQYFDFMGAGKSGENYGVREFKAKFGGNEIEYGRFLLVSSPMLYSVGKIGLKFFQLKK